MIQPAARTPPPVLSAPNSSEQGRKVSQDIVPMPEETPERCPDGTRSCSSRDRWMPMVASRPTSTT